MRAAGPPGSAADAEAPPERRRTKGTAASGLPQADAAGALPGPDTRGARPLAAAGAPLLSGVHLLSCGLISVICGGWVDDKQRQSGIQENMEKGGSGVTVPTLVAKEVHYKNQD